MPELPGSETSSGVAQLEWPEEVACLLKVWSDGGNLVDQVFHADDTEFAQVVFDQLVVSEWNALLVDLAIAALVDELTDGLEIRVAVGDVRVDDGEHFLCGFGQADEDAVIDLQETEELEDLAWFWCDLGDTLDTDDEDQFWLLFDVEGSLLPAQTSQSDLLALGIAVLLDVGLGLLEDDTTLLLVCLLSLVEFS